MQVVFVNRYFHPDHSATSQMLSGIAFGLAEGGLKVHVVTSRQRYEDARAALPNEETVDGVRVHRLCTTRFGRAGLVERALDYASFYLSATLKLLALLAPGDIVVAKTDPPLISICAALAARLRGARLITWQQDVFPETAIELGFSALAGMLGWPLRAARSWSLRVAAANVVLGDQMAERVSMIEPRARRRVHVIHNWADGDRIGSIRPSESPLRRTWALSDRFAVGYSGNMGRAHELDTIVGACLRFKDDPGIGFVFIGAGQKRPLLEGAVREHGLANVQLRSYVEEDQLTYSLGACDVHLVSLLPALEGLVLPSKFYGIAAAGRPTVFIGDPDGEIPRLLAKHDIGIAVRPGDIDGLVAALGMLRADEERRLAMGARARRVFESEWDRPVALAKWQALLESVAAKDGGSA